jgi:hypothetical protein
MEDALSPTTEWLRKHDYEAPQIDQETDRRAWRVVTPFDRLFKRGELEFFQLRAAEKLETHWRGSQGHDVRLSDEHSGGSGERLEYPRSYHTAMIVAAKRQLLPREWLAILGLLDGGDDLESAGRKWRACGRREIARAQGLALVSTGLERLAFLWGFAK